MPATMNMSSMMTAKLCSASRYTISGVARPRTMASTASKPPGCSG